MQEHIFPSNGIYYRTNDFNPARKTLVFIHGLSGSSSAWLAYENKFENSFNIMNFDLRGHGKSKKYPKYMDYDIQNFVTDIEQILGYLRIEKYILVSHSFGAIVALNLLKKHQEQVESAIFLAPALNNERSIVDHGIKIIAGIGASLFGFLPDSKRQGIHVDYSLFPNTKDYSIDRIYADVRNTHLKTYFFCLSHIYSFDDKEFLKNLHIPILIIHGTKDKMVPVTRSIAASKTLSNAELILVKNANHILILNNFEEVSDAMEKFLCPQ